MASFLIYPASAERSRAAISLVATKRKVSGSAWRGEVVAWSLIGVFFAALQGAGMAYLAVYMVKDFSYSAVAAGVFLAVAQGSGAVGRILWGWASDRWFKKSREKEIVIIGFIAAAASVSMGLLPQSTPHFLIGILVAVFGFTAIGSNAVFLTLVGEIAGPEKAGEATGLAVTIAYVGIIVGPPVFGMIADKAGDYFASWILYGLVLFIVNCFAVMFIKFESRKKTDTLR
jgi:MFS family permease